MWTSYDMSIKIGFSTGHTLVSKAIRTVTRSPVSHCFFLMEGSDGFRGHPTILAADRGGFDPQMQSVWAKDNAIIALFEPEMGLGPGIDKMLPLLGERYDYGGLIGDTFVMLGAAFGLSWKNFLHEPQSMFCSAAMLIVLQDVSYSPDFAAMDPTTVTPSQLYLWFTARAAVLAKPA